MAAEPVDLEQLPGETIVDQDGRKIGKVKDVLGKDGESEPMWVAVEASFGLMNKRLVLVPVARIKEEHDHILVPYSIQHVQSTPEVEPADELSPEDDRALRDHYGIDRADHEQRTDNESYATRVPDGPGTPPEEAYEVPEDAAGEESGDADDAEQSDKGESTDDGDVTDDRDDEGAGRGRRDAAEATSDRGRN
jgi:sporulation protein YlmC with PRC-barrel domain